MKIKRKYQYHTQKSVGRVVTVSSVPKYIFLELLSWYSISIHVAMIALEARFVTTMNITIAHNIIRRY